MGFNVAVRLNLYLEIRHSPANSWSNESPFAWCICAETQAGVAGCTRLPYLFWRADQCKIDRLLPLILDGKCLCDLENMMLSTNRARFPSPPPSSHTHIRARDDCTKMQSVVRGVVSSIMIQRFSPEGVFSIGTGEVD